MEQFVKSFPFLLKNDVRFVINILPLNNQIILANGQSYRIENLVDTKVQHLKFNGEDLEIPYRVYFNEPDLAAETNLTETQRIILSCLYLRHHNGYIRQKRLERLILNKNSFIIPFSFQLLGEYVVEIIEVLDKHININTINDYNRFTHENPIYWQQTQDRIISYWNAYYRTEFPVLKNYIGKQIVNRIKKNN